MHPSRVSDRLRGLQTRWEAADPADRQTCQALATAIGCRVPEWNRIRAVLDVCELLWLSWQLDMHRAYRDAERIASILREAQAPLVVGDGAILVGLMRESVAFWAHRRLALLAEKSPGNHRRASS